MRLTIRFASWCLLALSSLAFGQSSEQEQMLRELRALQWQKGPSEGRVGLQAKLLVPQGHVFLDATETSKFLKIMGNPPESLCMCARTPGVVCRLPFQ
jgi:uncharacterized membrane-anchored protein